MDTRTMDLCSEQSSRRHATETASMKSKLSLRVLVAPLCMLCALGSSFSVVAQDQEGGYGDSPLYQGPYLSPMGTGIFPNDDSPLDDGYGGTLAIGYRNGWYAMEIAPMYGDLDQAELYGLAINGLLFPFKSLPNFYGTVGLSGVEYKDYVLPDDVRDFSTVGADAGLGYIFPLSIGRYEFGIRAEARYRVSRRERDFNDADVDLDTVNRFKQTLVNIGLHLPLGFPEPVVDPVEVPVAVVEPAALCSDAQDNDGDGLVDFPADPGCTSADDGDETDPAQCSDGKDNDGDGLIDFPADKGCTAAEDNDETDPCKKPVEGEVISLKGCGTGDIIVLRGVNFEFDKARLTANAKAILDGVAGELTQYSEITIELGGHTDAKGSDEYNQALSERRAAAVVKYLASQGVEESRMSAVGYGEAQPVADNETDEGRELNRRVELKVLSGVAGAPGAAADAPALVPADSSAATPEEAAAESTAPAGETVDQSLGGFETP